MLYFSGNAHLLKYNICGWLICGEWKLADVVVKEEGDILFVSINSLAQRKAVVYGNHISSGRRLSDSRPQAFGHNGVPYREVWTDEKAVFRRKPQGHLFAYAFVGNFMKHLAEIDEESNEMMDRLVRQMAKKEGVTEQLKSDDWLCWLQKMNSIQSRAEEVVLHDLIYSL